MSLEFMVEVMELVRRKPQLVVDPDRMFLWGLGVFLVGISNILVLNALGLHQFHSAWIIHKHFLKHLEGFQMGMFGMKS